VANNFLSKAKNFFLPKFSEIDTISLVSILFITLLDPRLGFIGSITANLSLNNPPYEIVKNFMGFGFIILLIIGIIYKIISLVLSQKKLSIAEKRTISTFYYVAISLITFASIIERIGTPQEGIIKMIEFIFIVYILVRSFLTLIVLAGLQEAEFKEVYATQMTDEQISLKETIILLSATPIIYILLRSSNTILSTISLSFFYISLIFAFIRKYFPRYTVDL